MAKRNKTKFSKVAGRKVAACMVAMRKNGLTVFETACAGDAGVRKATKAVLVAIAKLRARTKSYSRSSQKKRRVHKRKR